MTEQWMTLNDDDDDERVLSRPKPGLTKQWMTLNHPAVARAVTAERPGDTSQGA